jgi:hypothetical protein
MSESYNGVWDKSFKRSAVDISIARHVGCNSLSIREKILVEDDMDILNKIVQHGIESDIPLARMYVRGPALAAMQKYAEIAIRARDAMTVIDQEATGVVRDDGVYFESAYGTFVYRHGQLEQLTAK